MYGNVIDARFGLVTCQGCASTGHDYRQIPVCVRVSVFSVFHAFNRDVSTSRRLVQILLFASIDRGESIVSGARGLGIRTLSGGTRDCGRQADRARKKDAKDMSHRGEERERHSRGKMGNLSRPVRDSTPRARSEDSRRIRLETGVTVRRESKIVEQVGTFFCLEIQSEERTSDNF